MLGLGKTVAAVILGLGGVTATAQAMDIDFSDPYSFFAFDESWGVVDYDTLVATISEVFFDSGYRSVIDAANNQWVAFNPYEVSPSTFTAISGGTFDLGAMWVAGAYGSQTLTITGFLNGTELYTTTIDVTMTAQYAIINFHGIDAFTIATGNNFVGNYVEEYYGQHWALGGITIGTPVPEPETYAMLLAGLGIVGAVARRRKVSVS